MPNIYKVTLNRDVGKFFKGEGYIGQHNGKRSDYFAGGRLPKDIIKKYGKDVFDREIIVDGDFNKVLLCELEKHYIQLYGTHRLVTGRGLNYSSGGEPSHGAFGINAGESHGKGVLPDLTIIEMLDKFATGNYTQAELAKEYGICQGGISSIINRTSRKYLDYDFSKIKVKRGDAIRGVKNSGATFTEDQVRAIRADYATGKYFYKDLCKKYKSTMNAIGHLVRRESWKSVE